MKSALAQKGHALAAHTPGPWTYLDDRAIVAGEKLVAQTSGINDRLLADARLIAAAPEMLQFAFHVLKSGACSGIPGLEGYAHLIIAKALGGPLEPTQARAEFVREAVKARGA